MKKERIQAKVADLELNEGQLAWLPKNPRQWSQDDIEKTKASLVLDPDFQEDNPIKVVPLGKGKLLVFAGNLRTTAARALKWKTFEAIQYTPESEEDQQTILRRAILDNGSFGAWDYDALANEWDALPLTDWGVPAWSSPEDDGMDMGVGNKTDSQQKYARICGFQIPLTEIEEARMKAAIEEYVDENGLTIGFFSKLLDDAEQQTDEN